MRIDRSRFLVLTAAIAACTRAEIKPAGDDTESEKAEGSATPPPTSVGPPKLGSVKKATPRTPDAPTQPAKVASPAKPAQVSVGGACAGLKPGPGPHCESFSSTVSTCSAWGNTLTSPVAEAARACLFQLSGTAGICGIAVSARCEAQASRKATVDPSTAKPCAAAASRCARIGRTGLDQYSCQQAASAANPPSRRAQVITCMSEACGVSHCL